MSSIIDMGGSEVDFIDLLASQNKADYTPCVFDGSKFIMGAHSNMLNLIPIQYIDDTSLNKYWKAVYGQTGQFYFIKVAPNLFVADRYVSIKSYNDIQAFKNIKFEYQNLSFTARNLSYDEYKKYVSGSGWDYSVWNAIGAVGPTMTVQPYWDYLIFLECLSDYNDTTKKCRSVARYDLQTYNADAHFDVRLRGSSNDYHWIWGDPTTSAWNYYNGGGTSSVIDLTAWRPAIEAKPFYSLEENEYNFYGRLK